MENKDTNYKKIAEETKYDANGKLIKFSLEEKSKRIENICRMVEKLECCLNTSEEYTIRCSKLFLKTILIPKYINLKPDRLSKMFKWLSENYKSYRAEFPNIPNFEEARSHTCSGEIINTWEEKYVNKRYSQSELSEAFRSVNKIVKKKTAQSTKKGSQLDLMQRMASCDKVYSISKRIWIDRSKINETDGRIVDPKNKI